MSLDDLMGERSYGRWSAYCQSKLANMLFAYELQRRLVAAEALSDSLAAHPGYAATNLQRVGTWWMSAAFSVANIVFAQSAAMGALPSLFAATSPGRNRRLLRRPRRDARDARPPGHAAIVGGEP